MRDNLYTGIPGENKYNFYIVHVPPRIINDIEKNGFYISIEYGTHHRGYGKTLSEAMKDLYMKNNYIVTGYCDNDYVE